jgi:hypothetical protein
VPLPAHAVRSSLRAGSHERTIAAPRVLGWGAVAMAITSGIGALVGSAV